MLLGDLFQLQRRRDMAATQLLRYLANKATEEQAIAFLARSGVYFQVGLQRVKYLPNGTLQNDNGQSISASASQVTGFGMQEPGLKAVPKPVEQVPKDKVILPK